jgi:plastocyanin
MTRSRPARALGVLGAVTLAIGLTACADTADSPPASASAEATPSVTATETPDATGSPSAEATAEATAEEEVAIEGSRYEPGELTIALGTEVIFENLDAFAHSVTEGTDGQAVDDAFVDEEIGAGETLRVTFDEPGTFEITCIFHPTMQMTIIVER